MSKLDKKSNESSDTQIKRLASLPANKICFDCDQRGPTYVNLTIGSFICMKCSGIIRGLNPPHRVKSISMATFSQKELTFLENTGNAYCQKIWLGLYDSQTDSQQNNLLNEHSSIEGQKEFLIDKYEKKMWYVAPEELIQQIEREKELVGLHKDKKSGEVSVKTGSSASFSSTDVAIIERHNTGQNQMVGRGEDNHSSSTNTSATSYSSFAILSSSDQGSTNTNYDMENKKSSYSLMQHKANKSLQRMSSKKLSVNQGNTTNSLVSVKGAPDSISMFLSSSGNDGNGGTNSPNNFVSTDEDGFCILDHNPSPTPSQQSGTKSTINQKLSVGKTNNISGMLGETFEDNFDTNSEEPFYATNCNKSNHNKQRTQQPSYSQSVTAFHIAKPPPSNSCKKTVSLNATPGTDCYLVRRNRKTSLNETSLKSGNCSVLPIPTSNCSSDSVTSSLNSLNLNNNVVNNNHIISGFTHILFSNENGDDKVNSDTKHQNGSGEIIINTKFKTSSETFDHSNGTTAELEINQKSVSSSTSYSDYASLSSFSPKTQDGLFALKPPHQPLTKRKISVRSNGGLSSITHITNHSSKDRVDKIFDNKTQPTQHFEDDFAINHGDHMPVENGKVIDGTYVVDPFADCGHIATLTNGIHPITTTQSSNNPSNICNKDTINNNNISVLHSTSVPPAERYSALAELDEAFHATKIHSDTLNEDSALFGTTTNHNSALPPFGNDVNHSTLGSADLKAIKNPFLVPLPVSITNPVLTNYASQITHSVWTDPILNSTHASENNSQNSSFNLKSKCQSQSNGSLRNSIPTLESRAFNGIEQPIPSRIMDKTYWPLSDSQQQKPSSQIDLFALKKNYSQNNSDSSTHEALNFFESFSTNNGGVNVTSYDNHPPNYGQHPNNNIYHHNKSHSDFQIMTNGWDNHINFNHTQNNNTSSSCFNATNYNNRSIAMVKPVSPTNPFL